MSPPKLKILIAKPGLDGHDVGAKVVARALHEAGHEVIYSGLHKTPREIAEQAVAEKVDVIGVSMLSGSHVVLCRHLRDELMRAGLHDRLWVAGGNIPEDDRQVLRQLGFRGVFATSSKLADIISFVNDNAKVDAQ
jgi:methylmalonyl-CoA mutase C-terminal domain/subunit